MDDFHPKTDLAAARRSGESLFRERNATTHSGALTPEMWNRQDLAARPRLDTRVSKTGPEDDFCNAGPARCSSSPKAPRSTFSSRPVYPYCPMTVRPIGDLRRETLNPILDRFGENRIFRRSIGDVRKMMA